MSTRASARYVVSVVTAYGSFVQMGMVKTWSIREWADMFA